MATCSMIGVYKPKKLFNLYVSIVNPIISHLLKTLTLALLYTNWKFTMKFEFDALIKNNT